MTFYLSYTTDPQVISLKFDSATPDMRLILANYSNILISGFSYEFNYTIENLNDNDLTYNIILSSPFPFVDGPILNYSYEPPDFYMADNLASLSYNFTTIQLLENYPKTGTEVSAQENMPALINTLEILAHVCTIASIFLYSGSSPNILGIMLFEMLSNMRFLNINYPPQVVGMFLNKMNYPWIFCNYQFPDWIMNQKKMPKMFGLYNLSVYYFNNVAEIFFQIFWLIFIGFCVVEFSPLQTAKNFYFFLMHAFVWDLLLYYIFSNHEKILISIFSSFFFKETSTNVGKFNLFFAILSLILMMFGFLYLYSILSICSEEMHEMLMDVDDFRITQSRVFESKPANGWRKVWDWVKNPRGYKFYNGEAVKDPFSTLNNLDVSSDKMKGSLTVVKQPQSLMKRLLNWLGPRTPAESEELLLRYQMIHVNIKYFTRPQKLYFLFFLLRVFVVSNLIMFFFPKTMQINAIIVINIAFLVYTVLVRPFNNKYDFITCVVNESCVIASLIFTLAVATQDAKKNRDWEARASLGWLIVTCNFALIAWIVLTSLFKLSLLLIINVKKRRRFVKKTAAL